MKRSFLHPLLAALTIQLFCTCHGITLQQPDTLEQKEKAEPSLNIKQTEMSKLDDKVISEKDTQEVTTPKDPAPSKTTGEIKQLTKSPKEDSVSQTKQSNPQTAANPSKPILLKVGTTADLTRSIKQAGIPIRDTMETVFKNINDENGINGVTIDYTCLDDGYEALRALANVQDFLSKGTDIVIAPTGTATLQSYKYLIEQQKLLVLFPMGSIKNILPYLVRLRVTYTDEVINLIHYVYTKYKPKKYVLFYQEDSFGKECLKAARQCFKKNGIKKWVEVPYDRNTSDFQKQAAIVRNSGADAIAFFATASAIINMIRQLKPTFFYEKILIALHVVNETQFIEFLQREELTYIISNNVMPNHKAKNIEIVRDFNNFAKENEIQSCPMALYGYVAASLLVDCLRRVEGPASKNSVLKCFENTKNYKFKDLILNFDPATHYLLNSMWINDNKQWVEIKDLVKIDEKEKR